jgi:hypothetical protein
VSEVGMSDKKAESELKNGLICFGRVFNLSDAWKSDQISAAIKVCFELRSNPSPHTLFVSLDLLRRPQVCFFSGTLIDKQALTSVRPPVLLEACSNVLKDELKHFLSSIFSDWLGPRRSISNGWKLRIFTQDNRVSTCQ